MIAPSPGIPGPQTSSAQSPVDARPAQQGYQPTADERELLDRVNQRINYQSRDSSRWALERQYFELIAFFLGIQWIEYTETVRRFVRWSAPSWFPTPISNAIKPRINAMVGRLLRSRPQGRVRPKTNDLEDRQAAYVAEKFVSHIYDVTDEMALRQLAAYMAALAGTVIARDFWNPQAGQLHRVMRTRMWEEPATEDGAVCLTCGPQGSLMLTGQLCPECGSMLQQGPVPRMLPDGQPALNLREEPQLDEQGQPLFDEFSDGEIETEITMLFNFYWDPKARTLKEAQWCGEARYVDIDWIDRNYPEKGPFVASEGGVDSGNFYEASLLALVGASVQGSAHYGGHQSLTNGAVLKTYEEKPSRKYPRGLHLVTANGVLLHRGDLPIRDEQGIPTGDFSWTEFRYDVVPGRFAGTTPGEDMVSLQRRINGIDAQVIINRKTLLNPWVLAPKGSGLNPGQTYMRPGATVLYNYIGVGAAPQVVHGVPLPAQVLEERKLCLEHMTELAEDPRVSSMSLPQNTRSGVALHWLKEQIDEWGIPRLERWAQWIAARDRKRLLLAQQHYHEQRAIKVAGEGSHWQIRLWAGADLRGNTDVAVDPGSLVPRSRSAMTQVVFDSIEAGILNPANPLEKQKILEELNLQRFETDIGPDRRKAMMENAMMDEGVIVRVMPEENHDIHAMEHLMEMKDPSFSSKPVQVQLLYRNHLIEHSLLKAQNIQGAQAGAPPPAGEGMGAIPAEVPLPAEPGLNGSGQLAGPLGA